MAVLQLFDPCPLRLFATTNDVNRLLMHADSRSDELCSFDAGHAACRRAINVRLQSRCPLTAAWPLSL